MFQNMDAADAQVLAGHRDYVEHRSGLPHLHVDRGGQASEAGHATASIESNRLSYRVRVR